jgi:hypothetical protein
MTVKECPGCNKTFETLFADRCPECEAELHEKELRQKKELLDERYKTVIKEMQLRKEFCHYCTYCNEQFSDIDECITHEKTCNKRPISKFY